MKKHYSRYTPEMVERTTGTPKDKFLKVCEAIASTAVPERTMTSLYALGWTQHSVGSQNIRSIAILQLLLGNMGMAGGGVNALRGHSNIQGLTDLGLLSHFASRVPDPPHRRGPRPQDLPREAHARSCSAPGSSTTGRTTPSSSSRS